MGILEDAGWSRLQDSASAYKKNGFYILHTRAIHPGSLIEQCNPWILEKSHAYYLIEVASNSSSKVLNSSHDLKELIVIVKLMGLL